jgi:O-antigen/teichoic acid export membrane protein
MNIIKEGSLNFLGSFIQALSVFVLYSFASRVLPVNEYADLRKNLMVFEILSPTMTFGLNVTIFYFFKKYTFHSIVKHILIFFFFFSLTLALFFFGFRNNIKDIISISNSSFSPFGIYLLSIINAYYLIFYALVIASNKVKAAFISCVVSVIVNICSLFFLYYFNLFSIESLIYSRLIAFFISGSYITIVLLGSRIKMSTLKRKLNFTEIYKNNFGIWFSIILGIATLYIDKVIVANKFEQNDYSVYVNGAFEMPFIGVFIAAITTSLIKRISIDSDFGKKRSAVLIRNTLKMNFLIASSISIFIIFFSREIITTIFGAKYLESGYYFAIVNLVLFFKVLNFGYILAAIGESKKILYRSVFEFFINLTILFIVSRLHNIKILPFSGLLTVLLWTVPFNFFVYSKKLNVTIYYLVPFKELCYYFFKVLIIGGIIYLLYLQFNINFLLCCLLYGILLLLVFKNNLKEVFV